MTMHAFIRHIQTLAFLLASLLSLGIVAYAQDDTGGTQSSSTPGNTAIQLVVMASILLVVLLVFLVVTWILFTLLWHAFNDPFVAVRCAYLISGILALAYLTFGFYPRFMRTQFGLPDSARWAFAGGLFLILVLVCALTFKRMPTHAEQKPR